MELAAWEEQVAQAREEARSMGVEFIQVDVEPFKEKVLDLHQEMIADNPDIAGIYGYIQSRNQQTKAWQERKEATDIDQG